MPRTKHLQSSCERPAHPSNAVQEARLHQLTLDLRSDLNSSSLSELKEMVSDFMQQMKDSMARQAQTQGHTDPRPILGLQQETLTLSDILVLQPASSPQDQSIRHLHPHGRHRLGPVDPKEGRRTGLISSKQQEAEEVQSGQYSRAHSVLTESEIELDLSTSQAGSEIKEEQQAAAGHSAESVAESVSDVRYSMDFESSIHRSPLSGFRSPVFGEFVTNLLY